MSGPNLTLIQRRMLREFRQTVQQRKATDAEATSVFQSDKAQLDAEFKAKETNCKDALKKVDIDHNKRVQDADTWKHVSLSSMHNMVENLQSSIQKTRRQLISVQMQDLINGDFTTVIPEGSPAPDDSSAGEKSSQKLIEVRDGVNTLLEEIYLSATDLEQHLKRPPIIQILIWSFLGPLISLSVVTWEDNALNWAGSMLTVAAFLFIGWLYIRRKAGTNHFAVSYLGLWSVLGSVALVAIGLMFGDFPVLSIPLWAITVSFGWRIHRHSQGDRDKVIDLVSVLFVIGVLVFLALVLLFLNQNLLTVLYITILTAFVSWWLLTAILYPRKKDAPHDSALDKQNSLTEAESIMAAIEADRRLNLPYAPKSHGKTNRQK